VVQEKVRENIEEMDEEEKSSFDFVQRLYDNGLSILQSMNAVRSMFGTDLEEAFRIVSSHPAWSDAVQPDEPHVDDADDSSVRSRYSIRVEAGFRPMPYFAEYPYFVWGEVSYDSDGDCASPTHREWTRLWAQNRDTKDWIEVRSQLLETGQKVVDCFGSSLVVVQRAAYLTALRTDGLVVEQESRRRMTPAEFAPMLGVVDKQMRAANRVHEMFGNPQLTPFDSHFWWGGWKWTGTFSTEHARFHHQVLHAVTNRHAGRELVFELEDWWKQPPLPGHRDGVRQALKVLTGHDPQSRNVVSAVRKWFKETTPEIHVRRKTPGDTLG
jgi:hypothetical protein